MPIDQSKLDALHSLATGGSPGLDAYRQAQGAEQASRTDALKGALGGQDIYAATQAAQAKYAPNVGTTPFADSNALAPAANQFLDQGAQKLADQKYQAQQELMLGVDAAQRAGAAKNQKEMLQGAADTYGEKQKTDLKGGQGLNDILGQRTALQNEKAALQRLVPQGGDSAMQTPEQAAANAARQGEIDKQLEALGQQYSQQATAYTGALGTDAAGLEAAYQSGDNNKVTDLLNYLQPKADVRGNQIDLEGNKRLQELAPAFGINELAAKGMFRNGEGIAEGLKNAQLQHQGDAYAQTGLTPGEQSATDAAQAEDDNALGGTVGLTAKDYSGLRARTGLSDDEIVGNIQSQDWGQIADIAGKYIGKDRTKNSVSDFNKEINDLVDRYVDDKGKPMSDDKKKSLAKLATEYYSGDIAKSKTKDVLK